MLSYQDKELNTKRARMAFNHKDKNKGNTLHKQSPEIKRTFTGPANGLIIKIKTYSSNFPA